MYTTCLFCNSDLGRNEVIETFPVGRRLAFDAARGRLWVVCRRCERWNLTPLEERWEAIEQCEKEFRATKLRVSTGEIGLARVKEGLELVRIGAPQRPEMAAWRYGDQFGRRRRRHIAIVAGGVAVAGIVVVAGPMMGMIGAGAFSPMMNLLNASRTLYRSRRMIAVPGPEGLALKTRLADLDKVELWTESNETVLRLSVAKTEAAKALPPAPRRPLSASPSFTIGVGISPVPWFRYDRGHPIELRGDQAIRAAGAILPTMNQRGGSAADVQRAVSVLEESGSIDQLYRHAAGTIRAGRWLTEKQSHLLKQLPTASRLALEMATHEESERRALEGELHLLEEAWREAEEIAGIADDMFLPASVETDLARLKRQRDDEQGR